MSLNYDRDAVDEAFRYLLTSLLVVQEHPEAQLHPAACIAAHDAINDALYAWYSLSDLLSPHAA